MIVVITGASSGIGKATALEFASKGAKVVVAARGEKALNDLVQEIETIGSQGLAVPTDVSDRNAVNNLADRAVEHFGNIDVWINNAAVTAFGKFEDIPDDIFKRVIEVNLFGYIYGAKAVLPHFRKQNKGVLINVSSVVGTVPQPFALPYVVSKHAITGFSETLRQELQGTNIEVCTVFSVTIDTPLFQNGANYFHRKAKAMPPVHDAKQVADAIVDLAENPRREVKVGAVPKVLIAFHNMAPEITEKMFAEQVEKEHFQEAPQEIPTQGNLFKPIDEGKISGGWK